jgi:hypothetical protein
VPQPAPAAAPAASGLLPPGWDARAAADRVLAGLARVTAPQVKGAHDAEMALVGGRAYIVAEVNDEKAGESAAWPGIYAALSVVDLETLAVERVIPFARGGQAFANETLPEGACFVPRVIQKDARTLRCFFASERPGRRQAQTWFIDFDIPTAAFAGTIHRAKLKTAAGVFDMQPQFFHADAAAQGFARKPVDFGLYLFDSFKTFGGETYVALKNYPGGQNALERVNDALDTFEVIGHYNGDGTLKLTESAVNRLPDGTWLAVCRQEGGTRNYVFAESRDGRTWTAGECRNVIRSGASSKPTFDRIGGLYWLGWQEDAGPDGVGRAVFNVEGSRDGVDWERRYRFVTDRSFQYPTFREHGGRVYVCVTQGDSDPSRKERIMFGRVE